MRVYIYLIVGGEGFECGRFCWKYYEVPVKLQGLTSVFTRKAIK